MLARWLRGSLILVLASLLVSAGMLGVGRAWAQPTDARASLLGWCDAAPCPLEIVPGASTWGRALGRVSRLPNSQLYPKQMIARLDSAALELYPSVAQGTVGRIFVMFAPQRRFDAGWVVQRYGVPCGVSIYPATQQVTLRYTFLLANIRVEDSRLSPHSAVANLLFSDPHFVFESQPDLCIDNITSRQVMNSVWQGFAPLAAYRARGAG